MTDESTVLDEATAAIVDKLRADLKKTRWSITRAEHEAAVEHANGQADFFARRAVFNRTEGQRWRLTALAGWACVFGLLVLVAAKW